MAATRKHRTAPTKKLPALSGEEEISLMSDLIGFTGPDPSKRPLGIKPRKRLSREAGLFYVEGYLPFDVIVAIIKYTRTGKAVTLNARNR